MKVAIYLRFSSINQADGYSLEAQKRAIDEFCLHNGYFLNKVYSDAAESATTDDRPQFLQMINDSALGLFDAIIVHKLDRFARNRFDSAIYRKKLKENGVKLISVLENFDDSPESGILLSVLEGMAEYYSLNLAREVKKGMKEVALQCKHTGGKPPLGFDVDSDKRYIINDAEAETVKLIFSMYADGYGFSSILDALKNKHTKTGKPFGKNSLHDILKNEKYIGTYIFNRSAPKVNGKRNNHKSKPDAEIIRIENGIPAIIDKNTWEKVQRRMKSNLHKSLHAKEIYLLSGLIVCGECGSGMCGNRIDNKEKGVYSYYECIKHKQTKTCGMKRIKKEWVEDKVFDELETNIFADDAIEIIANETYAAFQDANSTAKHDIKRLNIFISEIDTKINNILEFIMAGKGTEAMRTKLETLERDKLLYQNQIKETEVNMGVSVISKQAIHDYLSQYRRFEMNTQEQRRIVIQTFVKKIVAFPDHISIDMVLGTGWWRRTVQCQILNRENTDFKAWNVSMLVIRRGKIQGE